MSLDNNTASAFATSWNNLPAGSVYTFDQFEDWFAPLTKNEIQNKSVLELGCGNGSLLVHLTQWQPQKITGIDLGDSVKSCNENMQKTNYKNFEIIQNDLVLFRGNTKYDVTYSIGVIHHVKESFKAFQSVIDNTKAGGAFHCWVYAKEGNGLIRYIVDPIRKIANKLPWWFNKYFIATPLSFLYFLYAHFIVKLNVTKAPLFLYSQWICKRGFLFFRHVAFDQLVTPQTIYLDKNTIVNWMESFDEIDVASTYVIFRNGNSWKFGGNLK